MPHYENPYVPYDDLSSFTPYQLLAQSIGEYELSRPDTRKSAHRLLCHLESASLYRCLQISSTTKRELIQFLSDLTELSDKVSSSSVQYLKVLSLIDMLMRHHKDNMLQVLRLTNLDELSLEFAKYVQPSLTDSCGDEGQLYGFTKQLVTLLRKYLIITGTVFSISSNTRVLSSISQHIREREELDVLRWID